MTQREKDLVLEPSPIFAMRKILDYTEKERDVHIDIGRIPLNDKKTLNLFKKGDTGGVFGFDSPDMQKILRRLKPDSFDDLMALCALYRPETLSRPELFELLPEYIARKTSEKKIAGIHRDVNPILSSMCGMIVYQEQMADILCKMAGYTPERAEDVRRMIGKRNPSKMAKLEPEFFYRCMERGYSRQATIRVWEQVLLSAGQAALKTYVSLFTFVAYQFAYLKAHYKSEFCTAAIQAK